MGFGYKELCFLAVHRSFTYPRSILVLTSRVKNPISALFPIIIWVLSIEKAFRSFPPFKNNGSYNCSELLNYADKVKHLVVLTYHFTLFRTHGSTAIHHTAIYEINYTVI